ncbi:hypothetical protein DXG01_001119 [Tephrocybe rancida]|nr:hypothetical protein DXG01_001119 [Tephrocybe rancida]
MYGPDEVPVVAAIVNDFVTLFTSPEYRDINPTNERLEAAMRDDMAKWNLKSRYLEHTVHIGASLIELSFYTGTFEEKRITALYNWYITYVDDAASKDPAPYVAFQHRFMSSLPQIDPVLDAFAAVLHEIVASYPTLQANLVLSSTFEFFAASCLEPQLALQSGVESPRFPLFLRERSGLGMTVPLLLFSPSQATSMVNCYRALPDMAFWISVTNDVLSFYKEQRAGEAGYIHKRAAAEGRSLSDVLAGLKAEACESSKSIQQTLGADPAAVATWRMFENGFV